MDEKLAKQLLHRANPKIIKKGIANLRMFVLLDFSVKDLLYFCNLNFASDLIGIKFSRNAPVTIM
jgi:hypothetical protein